MEFPRVVADRYSVRGYTQAPVEEDKLARVLEAARLAPTATNRQPFRIYVIPTSGREAELRRIYDRDWFVQPPLVICVCCLKNKGWVRGDGKDFGDIDCAIVMDHIVLAATNEGLGTCWVANFNVSEARSFLGIGDDLEPIVFTPLGYPDKPPTEKRRKSLDELVVMVG